MKSLLRRMAPLWIFKAYHLLFAYGSAAWYGFPSRHLVVIGVVGTRGKTTTANLIWAGLTAAGYKTGLTSTANIRIGSEEFLNPYHMTMPGRGALEKLLYRMRKKGCTHAVVETPSEGVEQFRHRGIVYDIAVATRVYPEYLAVHRWDFERCKEMHAEIFRTLKKSPRKIVAGKRIPKVIIANYESPEKILFLAHPADRTLTYGMTEKADVRGSEVGGDEHETSIMIDGARFFIPIGGSFNAENILAAYAVLEALEIPKEAIAKGFQKLVHVPGRMEEVRGTQPFSVFVDYAHDEVSLLAALRAMGEGAGRNPRSCIVVLGAEGGGRDKKKRPGMGTIAAEHASIVVVTDVDPYDDDPEEIREDIARASEAAGKVRGKDLFVVEDRREGIRKALSLAGPGFRVLVTGKGAEQSMVCGRKSFPWDDRHVVREELTRLGHRVI